MQKFTLVFKIIIKAHANIKCYRKALVIFTSRFISLNSSTLLKTYPSTSTALSIPPPSPNRAHHSW